MRVSTTRVDTATSNATHAFACWINDGRVAKPVNTRRGNATNPVSRSSTTEANDTLDEPTLFEARAMRTTSPPMVEGSTLPTRTTTSDGVRLAVEVARDGPGLLLVHGLGGAKEDFSDHVSALARDYTVVIFDHRGHGASDKPRDRTAYSIDRLATDILEVADAVGLERFRLLGHSMGGMVGRQIPLRVPDRVEALVLMDTSAGPIPGF